MWSQIGPSFTFPGWHSGQAILNPPEIETEAILFKSAKAYEPYKPDDKTILPPLTFSQDDSKKVVDLTMTLNEFADQMFTDVLQNGMTDEKWNSYLEGLKTRNIDTLLALYQESYDKIK